MGLLPFLLNSMQENYDSSSAVTVLRCRAEHIYNTRQFVFHCWNSISHPISEKFSIVKDISFQYLPMILILNL